MGFIDSAFPLIESNNNEVLISCTKDPILMQNSIESTTDYFLSTLNSVQLVFGYHGSGKTSYCLNLVRLCLLGYLGCPIPAMKASIPIFHKLMIKMKRKDQIESLFSSFGNELIEINSCLENLKNPAEKKLVILDNFCCSSSHSDALAHLRTFIEVLMSSSCVVLVSTNEYQHLRLINDYSAVSGLCLRSSEINGQVVHQYRICEVSDLVSIHQSNLSLIQSKITDQMTRSIILQNYGFICDIIKDEDPSTDIGFIEEFNRILKELTYLKTFEPEKQAKIKEVQMKFFKERQKL